MAGGSSTWPKFAQEGSEPHSPTCTHAIAISHVLYPMPRAFALTSNGRLLSWDVGCRLPPGGPRMQDLGPLVTQGSVCGTEQAQAQASTQPQARTAGIKPGVIDIEACFDVHSSGGVYALRSDGSVSTHGILGHTFSPDGIGTGTQIALDPCDCRAAAIHPGPSHAQICVITGLPDPTPQ